MAPVSAGSKTNTQGSSKTRPAVCASPEESTPLLTISVNERDPETVSPSGGNVQEDSEGSVDQNKDFQRITVPSGRVSFMVFT